VFLTDYYREPSGKAPVMHPGDEPPFLYEDGSGRALSMAAGVDLTTGRKAGTLEYVF
jgi:hypothetical protein